MNNTTTSFSPVKLDSRLAAAPIQCHEWTIQPVAHISGWYWASQAPTASYAGALVQIQPVEMIAQRGDESHTVAVIDPVRIAMRSMMLVALAVSILCAFVMFLVHLTTRR